MLLKPGTENQEYFFMFSGVDKVLHLSIFIVLGVFYLLAFPKTTKTNYPGISYYNERLKEIGEELGFTEKLTSYVSRHSMAMTLQTNGVPREMISQVMGHKDLETTNTYLDSFGDVEIEKMTINSLYKINVNL